MDNLLLGQADQIIGWLTPVWLISVGITFGLVLMLVAKGLLFLLSRIPGLNTMHDSPQSRILASSFFTLVCMGGIVGYSVFSNSFARMSDARDVTLFVILTILVSVVAGFGFVAVVSRKRFEEIQYQPRGNFESWISRIAMAMSAFAVIGLLLAFVDGFGYLLVVEKPAEKLNSLLRLSQTGEKEIAISVPAKSTREIDVSFYGQELRFFSFKSDQDDVLIATQPINNLARNARFDVTADSEFITYRHQPGDARVPDGEIDKLYVKNNGDVEADLAIRWTTQVEYPQVALIPKIALAMLAVYLAYWAFCAACPKISAIAVSTFKTEISQPVFVLLAIIGCAFAVGSIYIPYYTLGEDIKMYKMSALTLIRIMGIFMAIWAASKSVAEEIEGRTALTVLSKPVGRRQFILGKFSGISLAIGLMFIIVGLWFVIWVCYKPIYDSRENSMRDFNWIIGFDEAAKTIPGLLLAYFESLVFVAISIAISTRLGILANFMVCFAIYVLGHLTPMIVQSAEVVQAFEPVVVFGQFISVIFPVLDHFDVEPAIIGDVDVPLAYLGWASVYCLVYGTIAMLLSLVFFEDRDLA